MGRLIVGSLLDLGWPADCLLVCSRDLDKLADLQVGRARLGARN